MILSRTRFGIALSVLALLVACGLLLLLKEKSSSTASSALSKEIMQMRELIVAHGGTDAYERMAQDSQNLPYAVQHTRAHNFGAALYMESGVDGLSVCDARFSFGCFHEFLGRAIADLGIESVNELNQRCRDALGTQSLSCQHGIGHGVLAFFGYEKEHLDQALDICKNMPFNDPIGGCYGGVFMEYNVRTMWGEEALPREYTGDPHAPCSSYDTEFQTACYYWLPQWWRMNVAQATSSPVSAKEYALMGAICKDIADPNIRLHCYEGIGNVTGQDAGFSADTSIQLCAGMNGEGPQLLCRSVAANHLGIDVDTATGEAVCMGLTGSAFTYCIAHAHNKLNILNRTELPFSI